MNKVWKIVCSLLVATYLFTGTAYADQVVSTQTEIIDGKEVTVQDRITAVVYDMSGAEVKVHSIFEVINNPDGTTEYKFLRGKNEIKLNDYHYVGDGIGLADVYFSYKPNQDGSIGKILKDNRSRARRVEGKAYVIPAQIPGQPSKNTNESGTDKSSNNQQSKEKSNSNKQSKEKSSKSQNKKTTQPANKELKLEVDITSREANPEPVSINIKDIINGEKMKGIGLNLTNSPVEPEDWRVYKSVVSFNKPGTYYLHYELLTEDNQTAFGYYGPYIITEPEPTPEPTPEPVVESVQNEENSLSVSSPEDTESKQTSQVSETPSVSAGQDKNNIFFIRLISVVFSYIKKVWFVLLLAVLVLVFRLHRLHRKK